MLFRSHRDPPCDDFTTGVTAKGLVVIAHYCPDLCVLRVHLQVDTLCVPSAISGVTPGTGSTVPRRDCALWDLEVGEIPLPEESISTVALTLAHIFPRLTNIDHVDDNWGKVVDAICNSREIISRSSKEHPFLHPGVTFLTLLQEPHSTQDPRLRGYPIK